MISYTYDKKAKYYGKFFRFLKILCIAQKHICVFVNFTNVLIEESRGNKTCDSQLIKTLLQI